MSVVEHLCVGAVGVFPNPKEKSRKKEGKKEKGKEGKEGGEERERIKRSAS